MNSYRVSYDQLRQQPEIAEMLHAVERGLQKFDIDYYLIGAVARDAWMSGVHQIAPKRTTGDIDFAVLVPGKDIYEKLIQYLVNHEGFVHTKENAFVLIWRDRSQVDLLPFGAIEDEVGTLTMNGQGLTNISLQGFTEVYEEGLPQLDLEGKHRFKFCSLPGIVLLKLIAWDDRPERRRDDIKDISHILNHFFNMYDENIFEHHHDLFGDEEVILKHIAARVMGREMKKIALRNERLSARIEHILNANTDDIAKSQMAAIMIEYFDNTMEDNVLLLRQLKTGFTE